MFIVCASVAVAVKDSEEKMITKQNMIHANDLATRLRKLKDNPYSNNENATIAIPAVKIWLMVRTMETIPPTILSKTRLSIEQLKNKRKQFHDFQKNHP